MIGAAVLFVGLVVALPPGASAKTARLLILHTNDLHDHVRPGYEGGGGLPYVAGYIAQVRAERKDVLLVDAGDVAEKGDLVAFKTHSLMTYEALRRIGYDAVTIGNHDHDQGLDGLRRYEGAMGQPFLCLNRVGPEGQPLFAASRIVERNGIKIGIIGLMVPQDEGTLNLEESGRQLAVEAERLDREVQLVIAVCHLGSRAATEWARRAPAVDIFVTGHSHEVLRRPIVLADQGTILVQAGSYARFVGRLEIEIDLATEKVVSHQGSLVEMKHDAIKPDAAFLAWVRAQEQAISPEATEFVLNNATPLGLDIAWLAAEALRRQAGTDIAFCHPGQVIRSALTAGPVDVNALFLTGGQRGHATLRTTLTGAEITAYLNALASPSPDQTAWSGFTATETAAADGKRTVTTSLEPTRRYSVLLPEIEWRTRFLRAAGRQKSGPLAGRTFTAEPAAATYLDALRAYLKSQHDASVPLQEAINRLVRRAQGK
jgi:2',3'-cyclic-nucleotide 2'-phosphodiesterase (5'-nucleotidase family)